MIEQPGRPSVRDHLANERTLLAWIRTAVTVIGLGFLIDRLAVPTQPGWEAYVGVALALFGALVALAGAYSYLNARRELMTGSFRPAVTMHLVVVAVVVGGGMLVAALLIAT